MSAAVAALPDGWTRTTLGAVLTGPRDLTYGIVQPGAHDPEGVPIVRVTDVRNGRVAVESPMRVEAAVAAPFQRSQLQGGELLITLVGTVGECAVAPNLLRGWNTARAVGVARVSPDVGADWVALCLRSREVQERIAARVNTTVQTTLNLKDVRELPIVLPHAAELSRIRMFVAALDDKIESNQRKISVSHELAASLCQSILGSPSERWTDAWPTCRLDDVLSTLEVGRRPAGGIKYEPNGIPSIGAESIVHAGSFDFSKTKRVSEVFFAGMRRGHLEHLDVLLYKDGGTPGNFIPHVSAVGHGFPFSVASINEHVYRLRIEPPYTQSFLYFWLSSPRLLAEMRRRGTGAAIPGLNSSAVRDLPVPQPPAHILSNLQEALDPLLDLILRSAKESRACAQLRDALLPELLSGRIRVPEAATT